MNVRFAGAREQGLTEAQVAEIQDGYEASPLKTRDIAALHLTDTMLCHPGAASPALQAELRQHFTDAEIVELAVGVGLFHSLSKVLVILGLEPDHMPTTILPTPPAQE